MFIIEYKDLNDNLKKLRIQAKYIRSNCRLIKSTTKVGCCILGTDDTYYFGCNIDFEFGKTVHAEETAIINMICSPSTNSKVKIKSLYIYAEVDQFTPCGDCRDKIMLHAEDRKTRIFVDNRKQISCYQIGDLLPNYPRR